MQANIFAILFQHLTKIHTQWFKDYAEMLLVVEGLKKTKTVEFVILVGFFQLVEVFELFDARSMCDVVVSDNFDSNFHVILVHITCTHNIGEYTLTSVTVDRVLIVYCFTNVYL